MHLAQPGCPAACMLAARPATRQLQAHFFRLLRLLTCCCWRNDVSPTQLTGTAPVGTLGDHSHLLLLAHTCPHLMAPACGVQHRLPAASCAAAALNRSRL